MMEPVVRTITEERDVRALRFNAPLADPGA